MERYECTLEFNQCDVRNALALDGIFEQFKPDAVIHFAGLKAIGESVAEPARYYDVNVEEMLSLLCDGMQAANIVFSSSATVYGQPEYLPWTKSSFKPDQSLWSN